MIGTVIFECNMVRIFISSSANNSSRGEGLVSSSSSVSVIPFPQCSWLDVQLGGIAVPRNAVGFLGIALAVLSEDGEGLGNRACNAFHFRTSVIQVLKKLKSRDSNGMDYLSQSFLPRRCLDCSFRTAALSSRSLRSCASLMLKSSLTFSTKTSTSFGKCSNAFKNGWHFSLSRS